MGYLNKKSIAYGIGVILGICIVFLIFLGAGTLLWAYFAPMFNLPVLSFWQFVGLWILTTILFGVGRSYK